MRGPGLDVGVLGVLPVRAAQLDSPEAVDAWLRSVGSVERIRQVGEMSREKLARFVPLLTAVTGPELLGSVAGVSAPMIATIVDGTGLIIYILIAHATLPQLAGL